jgi:hypothetical protein
MISGRFVLSDIARSEHCTLTDRRRIWAMFTAVCTAIPPRISTRVCWRDETLAYAKFDF